MWKSGVPIDLGGREKKKMNFAVFSDGCSRLALKCVPDQCAVTKL